MKKDKIIVFWFRRDLRFEDNHGLFEASKLGLPILPIFIFDPNILSKLPSNKDARVEFIHQRLQQVNSHLHEFKSSLKVFFKSPIEAYQELVNEFVIDSVYTNHDYEGYAIERDSSIKTFLETQNISFHTFKDQVIFEKNEVLSGQNTPYTIYTPYSRRWKQALQENPIIHYPSETIVNFFQSDFEFPSLSDIGFEKTNLSFSSSALNLELLPGYGANRDFPSLDATSHLSVHLRFGTISIRKLVAIASKYSEVYLNELIWRDFYFNILFHFPHISTGKSFKPAYDFIEWRNNEAEFKAWMEGKTGYPIVDAGMRELNSTGFMHNRVRMIVASFLVKHLLIDWRWGEAYFAEKLLDFDFSANNGGWQWASGSGCDAAPYFRVFNPELQTKKFDPDLKYIKKWVPEFQEFNYPKPIVVHEFARARVLDVYAKALKKD